jgi:signal peptidase I
VVGIPGDLLDAERGRLRRGRVTLAEPYLEPHTVTTAVTPLIVPPDSFYVLGDNRGDSYDSRKWGAIPRSLIVGRARIVVWSSRSPGRRIFKWVE